MDTMFTLQYHHQSFNSTITSSGSSRSFTHHHQPPEECLNTFFMEEDDDHSSKSHGRELLSETARAIADKNSTRIQQLMWMLNELSSSYGEVNEKLSFYFLQALFCRMTDSGDSSYRALSSVSEKTCSFESTRNLLLKFQEVSPWTTFGHVASNAAIMEAFDGETRLHIVDISNTYCTQWPTLLEAIATRTEMTHLTSVSPWSSPVNPTG
ncbi:hypothetical protein L1987_34256 [Smallanthus sonchifolius]|uniref:Uncharacterized protein n=1 Tax=Smallanthus sonchifolius TaxID=185202 RepID=A0ACB9HSK9_9ASTR|nr:hypothetical protein L1987_34256 [Smallanthus sonchifolius]